MRKEKFEKNTLIIILLLIIRVMSTNLIIWIRKKLTFCWLWERINLSFSSSIALLRMFTLTLRLCLQWHFSLTCLCDV